MIHINNKLSQSAMHIIEILMVVITGWKQKCNRLEARS